MEVATVQAAATVAAVSAGTAAVYTTPPTPRKIPDLTVPPPGYHRIPCGVVLPTPVPAARPGDNAIIERQPMRVRRTMTSFQISQMESKDLYP